MKENNKIELTTLRDRLQRLMQYDDPDYAFGELLGAWREYAHKSWYTGAKGWLSIDDAKSFSDYVGYDLIKNFESANGENLVSS